MCFTRLYKPILKILFLIFPLFLFSQNPYITVWQTDDVGNRSDLTTTTEDNEILIPASGEFSYVWTEVDNPENTGSGTAADETILSFPNVGTYEVQIIPNGETPFHRVNFGSTGNDGKKLNEIKQWGDVNWSSFEHAYYRAGNLNITATDLPDLSEVTNMEEAFKVLDGEIANINDWDVSQVTNMKGLFSQSNFNQNIEDWDVSQVNDMSHMFEGSFYFDQPLESWDVSNVEDMSYMFRETGHFNQPLNNWDVGKVTNMSGMFANAYEFNQPLNNWNTGSVTNMDLMFFCDCALTKQLPSSDSPFTTQNLDNNTTEFNQDINNWDVSQVVSMNQMFENSKFNYSLDQWTLSGLEEANSFLFNSDMNCENYSLSLKGWAENTNTALDVVMSNGFIEYSPDIEENRDFLIEELNWNLDGDALGTCTLSIEDHQMSQFNFYPNPAKAIINFETTQAVREIMIYNLIGQEVLFVAHPANRLDVSQLNPGMYMMSVEFDNDQRQILKLIKE